MAIVRLEISSPQHYFCQARLRETYLDLKIKELVEITFITNALLMSKM